MKKDYKNEVTPCELSDEDLSLINKYTVRPLGKDDVFSFNVILCNNEVDRDIERFDSDALSKLASLFEGKTGIMNHSMKSEDQCARIYKTSLITDTAQKTSFGENLKYIKASAYIPKTEKNADLISDITAGIKKEVSVNCSVKRKVCSICSKDVRLTRCEHTKGEKYNSMICHHILKEPTDAYEWSFVAVPAQRDAGVVKSFNENGDEKNMTSIFETLKSCEGDITVSHSQIEEINKRFGELEKEAEDGREYRKFLTGDVIRLSCTVLPSVSADSMKCVCASIGLGELKKLREDLSASVEKKAYSPVLLSKTVSSSSSLNNEFKI